MPSVSPRTHDKILRGKARCYLVSDQCSTRQKMHLILRGTGRNPPIRVAGRNVIEMMGRDDERVDGGPPRAGVEGLENHVVRPAPDTWRPSSLRCRLPYKDSLAFGPHRDPREE